MFRSYEKSPRVQAVNCGWLSRVVLGGIVLSGVVLGGWFGADLTAQERSEGRSEGRRRWDPASFLQRLDRNGNKVLEPDEMQGRAQGFVSNLGFDTNSPIPIENVIEKVNRDRSEAEKERETRSAEAKRGDMLRLVPDFGEEVALPAVAGFDEAADAGNSALAKKSLEEASDSVRSQVERVLRQYDENKNGALDANEIQNASWGQPSPAESDANRDGRLTQDELIARYQSRERDTERMNSRGGGNDSGGPEESRRSFGRVRSQGDDRGGESRSGTGRSGDRQNSSSSTTPSSSRSGSTRPAATSSSADRIAGYVSSQLDKYDKNHNGSLDSDELSAMSNAPKNADADGDGILSRSELEQYYGGGYRSSSSGNAEASAKPEASSGRAERAAAEPSKDEGAGRFRRRDSGVRRSRDSSNSSSDGTIRMSDFEPEEPWSEEKLKRFYELDANGDGIITPAEFNRRG